MNSDDFSGGSLSSIWSLEGPDAGATAHLAASGAESYLEIVVPGGDHDAYGAVNKSARVMQAATNEDFGAEVKFLSTPTQNIQNQGILVQQDATNWLRFDNYYSNGNYYLYGAVTLNGVSTTKFNTIVPAGSASYLRVERVGDLWTFKYSADGTNWHTASSYTHALTVTEIGPFAGPTAAGGYTAQVDYFFNTAAPIVPEDAPNAPPNAVDDVLTTALDTALPINVFADLLANDSDANGDPISLSGFTQPGHGTLVDNGDGTLTYTPAGGFLGSDSFTYTASDGADSSQGTVTVEVADPSSAPPVAQDDPVSTNEDTPVVINVLANDSDPDGDPLSLQSFTQAAHGTVVDNGDGTLTYTPNADFNGQDSFGYIVTDGRGQSDDASVAITVNAVNDAPIANDDAIATGLNQALVLSVASLLANDSDVEGSALSLASFKQPAHGTLVNNGNGTLTYTPQSGFIGTDSFTYTASDGSANSNQATVRLEVGYPASIFSDDFSGGSLSSIWSLEGPDAGATAHLAASGAESYLEIVVPGGDHDAYGAVNKSARVMQAATNEDFGAEVKFLSTPTQNIQNQGILVQQDATNWLRFDNYYSNGNYYLYGAVTLNGVSTTKFNTIVPAGSASYLRVERVGDLWTFKYSADGTNWHTASSYTHALTVTEIGPFAGPTAAGGYTAQVDYFFNTAAPIVPEDAPNAPPNAVDDVLTTALDTALPINVFADLLANDSDANGDPISLSGFTQPGHGTLVDNGDGTLTYTPAGGFLGSDSFTYTASDGADSSQGTVTVEVADPSSAPPVAQDDPVSTNEDTPVVINVLANDSDPDGDPLSLQSFTQAAHGTVVDNGDGTLTYTPNADFNGQDSFGYIVTDGRGQSDDASVAITVNAVNDAPIANDDAIATGLNQALVLSVASLLANDSDVEGSALSLASFKQPAHGTLVNNGNGTLTYTPQSGFIGTDSFTYTASDGSANSNQATVRLEVGYPASIFSDDFSGGSLSSIWSLEGPDAGATAHLAASGAESYLEIVVPGGDHDAYGAVNKSARVMQAATNEDFGAEVKFLSTPTQNIQNQGILVQQDATNWLRFDNYYSNGNYYLYGAVTLNGVSTTKFNTIVPAGSASYLRVERVGDLWTFKYSADGTNWHTAAAIRMH